MMYTAKGQLDRDALFHQHVGLVQRIAHHMIAKLPPNVEVDDLIQVGLIAVAQAALSFEWDADADAEAAKLFHESLRIAK